MQQKYDKIVKVLNEFEALIKKYEYMKDGNYKKQHTGREAVGEGIGYYQEEVDLLMEDMSCESDEDYDDHDNVKARIKSLVCRAKDTLIELGDDPDAQEADGAEDQ